MQDHSTNYWSKVWCPSLSLIRDRKRSSREQIRGKGFLARDILEPSKKSICDIECKVLGVCACADFVTFYLTCLTWVGHLLNFIHYDGICVKSWDWTHGELVKMWVREAIHKSSSSLNDYIDKFKEWCQAIESQLSSLSCEDEWAKLALHRLMWDFRW